VPWFERRAGWFGRFEGKRATPPRPEGTAVTRSDLPGIVIKNPRCPACRSKSFRTTKPVRRQRYMLRYHVCKGCGLHFKSIEPEDEK